MIAWLWAYHIKYRAHHAIDVLLRWVAWHLPRKLVMWCYVRVGAHATTGAYGDTVVPDLAMMEALRRWDA